MSRGPHPSPSPEEKGGVSGSNLEMGPPLSSGEGQGVRSFMHHQIFTLSSGARYNESPGFTLKAS
jgi:hypothetical protein